MSLVRSVANPELISLAGKERQLARYAAFPTSATRLVQLNNDDSDFSFASVLMRMSIREHRGDAGGIFDQYEILKVCTGFTGLEDTKQFFR